MLWFGPELVQMQRLVVLDKVLAVGVEGEEVAEALSRMVHMVG
jgi:hypothetical protein